MDRACASNLDTIADYIALDNPEAAKLLVQRAYVPQQAVALINGSGLELSVISFIHNLADRRVMQA